MDTSIRVLVANRPRLLRELVLSTLSEQAGISVVGETDNEQDVPSLVAETKPDFLLIAFDEPQRRPALCDLLLNHCHDHPFRPDQPKRVLRGWPLPA